MGGVLNSHGQRLQEQFEPGPDGLPATDAYLCDGNRWTLWLGSTEWPNGDPVKEGDTCTKEQGWQLNDWTLQKFGDAVDSLVTRPMTANQRSAFVLLSMNIGIEAFSKCTVLARFNAGNDPQMVAEAFGMWCKATSKGPNRFDRNDPYYLPIMNAAKTRWIDENGKPTSYQRAFPGLLRRHLAEGCLFLGLDWSQACRKDTVAITSQRVWDPTEARWEDRVRKKTELADVLALAKQYPLGPTEPVQAKVPVPASIALDTDKVALGPIPDSALPGLGAVIDGIPVNLPLPTFEEELILDQPAASEGGPPDANGAELVRPSPADVRAPQEQVSAGSVELSARAEASSPVQSQSPPVATSSLPPAPPPPEIKSVPVSHINVGQIRVENGVKPMEQSDRAIGFAIKMMGMWLKILAGRGAIPLVAANTYFELFADPFITSCVIAGAVWCFGFVLEKIGSAKRNKHLSTATTALT